MPLKQEEIYLISAVMYGGEGKLNTKEVYIRAIIIHDELFHGILYNEHRRSQSARTIHKEHCGHVILYTITQAH